MTTCQNNLYCGPLSPEMKNVICGHNGDDNIFSWFGGAKVYFVHTARTAIHRTCELLNVKAGDEILAPEYNCGAEIDALLSSGATVKLYAIEQSGLINWADLYARVSEKTRVIYITHYFGFAQDIDGVRKFCDDKGIYLVEDCALALFSCNGENKIGTIGDIAVFNLPKFLPVPDGGVLQINNPKLAAIEWKLSPPVAKPVNDELLRLFKRQLLRSLSGLPLIYSTVCSLLSKSYRHYPDDTSTNSSRPDMPERYYYDQTLMTDRAVSGIAARIAGSLSIAEMVSRRRANFERYLEFLADAKNIRPFFKNLPAGVNPLSFPIIVKHRQWVCDELNELSIAAIPWWAGFHRQIQWQEYPNACFLKDHLIALPVHHQLQDEHIEFISNKVIELANWHT